MRLPLREWFTKRPNLPDSAVASILEFWRRKIKKIKNVSQWHKNLGRKSVKKFNWPVLLISILEVVHVAAGILVFRINFLPFIRFGHINQIANIFDDKFTFRKRFRCHNASSFQWEFFDHQSSLLTTTYGCFDAAHLFLFDSFFRFAYTPSHRKEVGQFGIFVVVAILLGTRIGEWIQNAWFIRYIRDGVDGWWFLCNGFVCIDGSVCC